MKNVTMTAEEYELYCQFLKQHKLNKKDPIKLEPENQEIITEIAKCFDDETFKKLNLTFWKYPKGTIFKLSGNIGYLVNGIIKTEFNSNFLSYVTSKNWVGTLKISSVLGNNRSWMDESRSYKSNVQLVAHTDIILAMIDLDPDIVDTLKNDHTFKNTLLRDLVSIIRANDSLNFLIMHKQKVSIMATYILWLLQKEELSVQKVYKWKPVPTELSARLNFSLSDTRRSIDKLVKLGAITEGEDFAPNTKKKYYLLDKDSKKRLLEISGLQEHQIQDLARILFDPIYDDVLSDI